MGKPQPTSAKPPPTCKAFLLCERAIVEAGTESVTLIGIINGVDVDEFPASLPPITTYLHLVDGIGSYEIHMEMQDLNSGEVIASSLVAAIEFPERPGLIELIIPISFLPIEHAGVYDIVVLANEQEIERQKLTVGHSDDSGDENNVSPTPEEGD